MMNILLNSSTHKIESPGVLSRVNSVAVTPKDLTLLFPDEALAELDDLATDKGKPKGDRGKARKTLTLLSSSEPIDASSPVFLALLDWATVLESFDATDVANIKTTLGVN